MAASEVSGTTLFVGNLPESILNNTIEEIFSDVGPLKRCFIVTDKVSHKSKGIAYVTYALREHAEAAITKIKHIEGKRLHIKFARKRSNNFQEDSKKEIKYDQKSEDVSGKNCKGKKRSKQINKKNARLIIRNLSFKATEDDVKAAFQKYGTVKEIVIPLLQSGEKKGCCFVQYDNIKSAQLAIQNMNAKKILGRIVAVDWCIPKSVFLQVEKSVPDNTKKRTIEDDKSKPKDTLSNVDFSGVSKTKSKAKARVEEESEEELGDDEDEDEDEEVEEEEDEEEEDDEGDAEEDDDEDENMGDKESEDIEEEDDDDSIDVKQKRRKTSSDVNEGKTLFLRNLTFSTTQGDLIQTFSKFGKLSYALLCVDNYTEHPKGTGFIKFEDKDEAEKCLTAANDEESGGIIINGNKAIVAIALSRDELNKKLDDKKSKKDVNKRNLHLAREGLIRPGTLAANGVSASDMAKRQKLETWKKNMLRNLHMFISPVRLCIRNIPLTMKDAQLKENFLKAVNTSDIITECRIIRDMNKRDSGGIPLSKGFAFITFTKHESALKALREINNNPSIFTKDQRPIVEFSIENRAALKAKEKRLLKSKQKLTNKRTTLPAGVQMDTTNEIGSDVPFMGSKANPKMKLSLPSHSGPKIRHKSRQTNTKQKISRKQFIKNRHKKPKQFKRPESTSGKKKKKLSHDDKIINIAEKRVKKKMMGKSKAKKKWFE